MNWEALSGALAFLTVFPARRLREEPGRAFAWFPAVGLVIGCALAALAAHDALPRSIVALTVLVGWIIVTGGLTLNGLGNFCDGLLTSNPADRRLEIMKGPRSGKAAVIGLILVLLAKWVLIQDVTPFLLLVPPILGRWAMTLAAYAFPYRNSAGAAVDMTAGLTRGDVLFATGLTGLFILPALLVFASGALLAVFLTPVLVFVIANWSASRLDGALTGDVYGALCEATELLCLFCLLS